jgi:fructoselysine 6-kinase
MKVAAVGFTCIDIYENLDHRCYATGNGVDVLINLTKRGIKGSVVSAVGDDEYGKLMLDTLTEHGIDNTHVHVVPQGKTAVIKMSLQGKDRVHGECLRGVMEDYRLRPGDMEFIQGHDIIHTDLSWKVVEELPRMREKGSKVFFRFFHKVQPPRYP